MGWTENTAGISKFSHKYLDDWLAVTTAWNLNLQLWIQISQGQLEQSLKISSVYLLFCFKKKNDLWKLELIVKSGKEGKKQFVCLC